MQSIDHSAVVSVSNIFNTIPTTTDSELFETLAEQNGITIERIISFGQSTPPGEWYDQERHEFVMLLSGSATLLFENSPTIQLHPGDYLIIPAHTKHRVEQTSSAEPSIWLAFHYR